MAHTDTRAHTHARTHTRTHTQEYERVMLEVLPACRLVSGRYVEQLCTLIDVGGFKMK